MERPSAEDLAKIGIGEQDLFGLQDLRMDFVYASAEKLEELRKAEQFARIEPQQGGTYTVYIDQERLPEEMLLFAIDHELGHVILNPTWFISPTGYGLEDIQATHIAYACDQLRKRPEEYKIRKPEVDECIAKALCLTRLSGDDDSDANDWVVLPVIKENILDGEERLPAFAKSQYDRAGGSWGIFGARQIELEIDLAFIEENQLNLAEIILEELWRVVLNPYHRPERTGNQDRIVRHIMGAMRKLGWGSSA